MFVVTATLSISPGHVPAVTKTVTSALRAAPAGSYCAWMLSAEIGEVNTLLCAFAGEPLETLLVGVRKWIADLRVCDAAGKLRHVATDAYDTPASLLQLQRLAGNPAYSVLLQLRDGPAAQSEAAVSMVPLTGIHGRSLVLTATATHDEALAISRNAVENEAFEIHDSSLWTLVRLGLQESNSV